MIISTNNGGLSNRIKSLVSVLRYGEMVNSCCGVLWKKLNDYSKNNHILNCEFKDIFDMNIIYNVTKNCEEYLYYDTLYNSHCLMVFDEDDIPINFNNFDSGCPVKFSINDKRKRNIDFMYESIPINVINAYTPYFRKLKLTSSLDQKINEFALENFNENTTSVHIRSWNRNSEASRREHLFDIRKFEEEIERRIYNFETEGIENYNFFLATDSQDVREYFTNEYQYKDRIIVYLRNTSLDTSRDFTEGVQEDAIELFLLGKNKNGFIGSHFSTFSEVGWWLADCPEDVVIL
jgi:hypothetical protein